MNTPDWLADAIAAAQRPDDPEWRLRALCRGSDVEQYFPAGSGPMNQHTRSLIRTCGGCPVRAHCLASALRQSAHRDMYGVYGGTLPHHREKIRAQLAKAAAEKAVSAA